MNYLLWYAMYLMLLLSCYGAVHIGDASAVVTLAVLVLFPLAVPRREKEEK
jgi:hypothetical protein